MRKRTPAKARASKAAAPKKLKTVASVLKAFGGEKQTAAWVGTDVKWVRNWKRWRYIPSPWYWLFAKHLRKLGYGVEPSVFGFKMAAYGDPSYEPKRAARRRARI